MAEGSQVALDVLEAVERSIGSAATLVSVAAAAAESLGERLQLGAVVVELSREGRLDVIAQWGTEPDDDTWRAWRASVRSDLGPAERDWRPRGPGRDGAGGRARKGAAAHEDASGASVFGHSFPVMYLGRPVGLISVSRATPLSKAEMRSLAAVAQAVGNICSLMHLKDQLESQTREYMTLMEVGKALNSKLDLDDLLLLIAQTTVKLTKAESAAVLLFEGDDHEEVRLAAACGKHESEFVSEAVTAELAQIAREVGASGRPRLASDGSKASRKNQAAMTRAGMTATMAIPLSMKERVLGVLVLAGCEAGHFSAADLDMARLVADQAGVAVENARLYGEMQGLYVATIRSLAFTLEAKDRYTRGHSDRVTEYAVAIADRMGFDDDEISILRFAGILHDIGKIAISEDILNKPGKLSPVEREVIETHPVESARIIRPIGFLKDVVPIVEHHHEWFDGTGYNTGLVGEDIPKGARVLSVADAFEAMTSDRPYHGAMPWTEAVAELKRYSGTQFDPEVVDVFVEMILESVDIVEGA
jgi:putative nucleotidyltransferase with HDIG domain